MVSHSDRHSHYTTDQGKVKWLLPGLGRDDGQRLGIAVHLVAEQVEARQHMTGLERLRFKEAGEISPAFFLCAQFGIRAVAVSSVRVNPFFLLSFVCQSFAHDHPCRAQCGQQTGDSR
jgi:hypothetical protein